MGGQRAPHTAFEWLRRFDAELESLAGFPERCALAPENAILEPEIRQLVFGRRRARIEPCLLSLAKKFEFFIFGGRHAIGRRPRI